MSKQWRLIIDGARDAYTNMAFDKAIMMTTEIPVLRLYQWEPPAVSIGCFQGLEEEVDIKKCKELGIDYVRRITGGGAVFHDKELTYSVILKEKNNFISADLHKSYEMICGAVVLGLKELGIQAEYVFLNDIVVNQKKISGSAQTRRGGKLLQHGTLIIEVNLKKMFSILKVPDEKIRDKLISKAEERVTSLAGELEKNISCLEVMEAVKKGFEKYFGITFFEKGMTNEENKLVQKIKKEQFSKKEWNYAR